LALALDVQHAVAALLAGVVDVRADGFGDPQSELEQHEQPFAGAFCARGSDQPARPLLAQAGGRGLLGDLRGLLSNGAKTAANAAANAS